MLAQDEIEIKQESYTPQGIVKRVMPDKRNQAVINENFMEKQAHSVEPEPANPDTMNSFTKDQAKDIHGNFIVMETHRVPVIMDQRVPPLTDRRNTDIKNLDTSLISMNIKSTFRQEDKETEEG